MFIKNYYKNSLFYFLSIILIIVILELFSRILFSIISFNHKSIFYGFDKKIQLQINSLKKFSFSTIDNNLIDKSSSIPLTIEIKNEKKFNVWVFGGSTSDIACRNSNSTSWPIELQKISDKLNVKNFAKSGTNSDFAINRLISEINKKQYPDIILWANYVNEQDVIFWGLDRNKKKIKFSKDDFKKNKFFYNLKKISKTLDENSVLFFLMNNLYSKSLEYFFPNFAFKTLRQDKIPDKQDYDTAAENYLINTLDAFTLSKKIKSKFYIVTLASKDDFKDENKSVFYKKHFKKKINYMNNNYKIKLINTKEKKLYYPEFNKLFCDNIHFTSLGNQFFAKLIYEEIF
tara:strand:- start:377 stop:1411 length:1035 start_codon:yes stop_codon:yes gene_type:complete